MTPRPPELALLLKLDKPLQALFESSRRSRYSVFATDAEPDLSTLYVDLHFLSGQTYCCPQPDCHISPRSCDRLIRLAADAGMVLPKDLIVRWHCVVEPEVRLRHAPTTRWTDTVPIEFDFVSPHPAAFPLLPPAPSMPPDFTGIWTTGSPGGGRTETEFVNGVQEGIYRAWTRDGVCLREGTKRNGHWHGTLITRAADGIILDMAPFDHGTGVYRIFNTIGQLVDEIPLRAGKHHGMARRWLAGKPVETRHYIDGVCQAINLEAKIEATSVSSI